MLLHFYLIVLIFLLFWLLSNHLIQFLKYHGWQKDRKEVEKAGNLEEKGLILWFKIMNKYLKKNSTGMYSLRII